MNSRIAFAAVLALALSFGLASRASAQKPDRDDAARQSQPAASQPDNDQMASPAAQQPAAQPDQDNMSKPADQDRDKDKMSTPAAQDNDRDRDKNRDRAGQRSDNDTTKQEVATFDSFLDSHPKIARDLREDPSKVNDAGWVSAHPELKQFLDSHPRIREEVKENPQAFFHKENRYEKQEDKH